MTDLVQQALTSGVGDAFELELPDELAFQDVAAAADAVFVPLGFGVQSLGPETREYHAPALLRPRQHPLLGAGVVELATNDGRVTLTADMSGATSANEFARNFMRRGALPILAFPVLGGALLIVLGEACVGVFVSVAMLALLAVLRLTVPGSVERQVRAKAEHALRHFARSLEVRLADRP